MMESMLIVHNVQIDVPNVTVVKSVPLAKPTEYSLEETVNVNMDIMKYVVPKELLVMFLAHNQNVSNVTILVHHVKVLQPLV
jgi:hypothetical protein